MLKLILLFSIVIFVSCKLTTNCYDYHQGTFLYKSHDYGDTILIQRNDSIETTTHMQKGFISHYRIIWKSPCEYDRYLISTTDTASYVDYSKTHPVHISILRGLFDYYVIRVTSDDNEDKTGFVDKVYLAQ